MAEPPQVPRAPGTDADGNTHGKAVGLSAPADVPAAGANSPVSPKTSAEADTGAKVLDGIQIGLDVVGLIPGVGEFADLANVGISAARGDWLGASLSLASAIPFAGWFATGAKAAKRVAAEAAAKTAKNAAEEAAEQAAKHSDEAAAAAKKGDDGGKVKGEGKPRRQRIGDCGEQLARDELIAQGFDEVYVLKNNSGHGVDIIGRSSESNAMRVVEVKATEGGGATQLAGDQRSGGEAYTKSRLERAERAKGHWSPKNAPGAADAAKKISTLLDDADEIKYQHWEVQIDDIDKGCKKKGMRVKPW